jgi:aryl-alcohol dehydrogenase-like predicted oxidoreductase
VSKQSRPWWLPHLLAAGVVLPIAAGVGLIVHGAYTDAIWAAPGSGFAWLGVFLFTPALVLAAALACWAAARRDAVSYQGAAGFFVAGRSVAERFAQGAGCRMGAARERPADQERGSRPGGGLESGAVPVLHPFLLAPTRAFGRPVCRLGLASYGKTVITPDDVLDALGRGVNFLNWPGLAEGPSGGDAFSTAVASLGTGRQSVVVCTQFGARDAADAAAELRSALAALRTDYIDVLTLYYVESPDEWEEITAPGGALRYLRDAQRGGAVRRLGVTSHQRKLAARMAESGLLDLVMVRYNAAHRGAERDVFPVTASLGLPVITYTALRWGALLRPTPEDPPGFSVPRAPDWYRFVLQHPAVAVTLAAPQTRAELEEDLHVLEATGPLGDEEYAALAGHGERVRRNAGSFQ